MFGFASIYFPGVKLKLLLSKFSSLEHDGEGRSIDWQAGDGSFHDDEHYLRWLMDLEGLFHNERVSFRFQ